MRWGSKMDSHSRRHTFITWSGPAAFHAPEALMAEWISWAVTPGTG